jgi:hypothetical protein
MILKQYFTTKFLFEINRVIIERSDRTFLIIGILAVTLAIVFKLSSILAPTPVDKKYRNKFFNLFLTIGLGEVFWYGARTQNVKLFGTHFMALLLLLVGLVWLVMIFIKLIKSYGREKKEWEKEQVKLKYLPK